MPPKNKGKAKPKRVPHANETPLKHKAPGHGAVERAKDQMWSPQQQLSGQQNTASTRAAPARPKYKATAMNVGMGIGMGIGRGGGGAVKKKPVRASKPVVVRSDSRSSGAGSVPANPDSDFFSKPPI